VKESEDEMLEFLIIFLTVLYKYVIMNTNNLFILYYAILGFISVLCVIKTAGMISLGKMPDIGEWPSYMIAALGFIAFITVLSKDANFILPFLIGIAFCSDSHVLLVKNFFISSLLCFSSQIVLFAAGLTKSRDLTRFMADGGIITRSSIGFDSPNAIFCFFLPVLLTGYLLIEKSRWKAFYYCISVVVSLLIYNASGSRTSIVLFFTFFVVSLFVNNVRKRDRYNFTKKGITVAFFVFVIVSLYVSKKFGADPKTPVNIILTGRPYIWNSYLSLNIPLIGGGVKSILPDSVILPQYARKSIFKTSIKC